VTIARFLLIIKRALSLALPEVNSPLSVVSFPEWGDIFSSFVYESVRATGQKRQCFVAS
jgi:hypothetical protein